MRRSSASALSASPSKRERKEAIVPVVPFDPRKGTRSRASSTRARSSRRSWIQRQARLPTVVGWAGWKWV